MIQSISQTQKIALFAVCVQLFVRLFVDENLDRSVPISKQPKDKIQAILEACDRQFPEFHDRARKRIRTYLKSCRRMRRCKDGNGLEQVRLVVFRSVRAPVYCRLYRLAYASITLRKNERRDVIGLEAEVKVSCTACVV